MKFPLSPPLPVSLLPSILPSPPLPYTRAPPPANIPLSRVRFAAFGVPKSPPTSCFPYYAYSCVCQIKERQEAGVEGAGGAERF